MLRKFRISVNGKEYEVEMEELTDVNQATDLTPPPPVQPQPGPMPAQPKPQTAALEAVSPTAAEALPKQSPTGGSALEAPMPGTILALLVQVGDRVIENQPILILEAMKMENEIVADKDGVITEIQTTEGAKVNAGDPLITID